MSTAHARIRRYPYRWRGDQLVREKRIDEVLNEAAEFVNELDGETISTTSWDTSGPTITGTTVTTGRDGTNTKVTFTITGVGGATLTITTSGSRTLERRFLWEGINADLGDYKD